MKLPCMPAQAAESQAVFDGVIWLGAIVAVVSLGVVIAAYARRRLTREREEISPLASLHELRKMLDCGDLTQEEFAALKSRALAAHASAEKPSR